MKRFLVAFGGAVLGGIAYWALAQPAPPPIATLFPSGAVVYLEARDFASLLADWNGSAEKSAWLGSSNYEAFSRSDLFLRLAQAQTEFAGAAGVPPDYALLLSVAGTSSALALYNIGNLELLYVTHVGSARALDTALWKSRGSYQTRRAGGVDYYVKRDPTGFRTAAFAYSGDTLILATTEELIAGALELLARQSRPSVVSEKWYADAVQAAQPGANDLRLVYNMQRLVQTPHFRSYWTQRNVPDLREFSSGVSDLERSNGQFLERRALLRSTPSAPVTDEASAGQLLALVPDDVGYYRARLQPTSGQAEHGIAEKVFSATAIAAIASKQAPAVINEAEAGSEQDLETRIDEEPLADNRGATVFAALRQQLSAAPIQAMLEVGYARARSDQVFVGSDSAVVLLAAARWDAAAVRAALTSAAGSLWSNGGSGAGWRAASAGGVQELDGLAKLALAVDGRWLMVGNSTDLVNSLFSRRNLPPVPGAVYAAGWRHARELPGFERLTRLIDFPQIPPPAAEAPGSQPHEPMFYSENVASLGRVLRRVQSATLAVHDTGTMLRESAVYRIAP
jgi:hypothetical protein